MTCKTETMEARLLRLLKKQWLTPLDALNKAGCLSLSQRAGEFARAGHALQKRWVELSNGKRVRAYRIG